ncbi:MAG TPA: hypothetical protein QF800_01265 [Phycisphaerales bacterium]|nr:hypothetical protein [Phycisphaerales bacterium]
MTDQRASEINKWCHGEQVAREPLHKTPTVGGTRLSDAQMLCPLEP